MIDVSSLFESEEVGFEELAGSGVFDCWRESLMVVSVPRLFTLRSLARLNFLQFRDFFKIK